MAIAFLIAVARRFVGDERGSTRDTLTTVAVTLAAIAFAAVAAAVMLWTLHHGSPIGPIPNP